MLLSDISSRAQARVPDRSAARNTAASGRRTRLTGSAAALLEDFVTGDDDALLLTARYEVPA